MSPYPIVDAHLDIAYEALVHERDFLKSAHDKRSSEGIIPAAGQPAVGLPDLLAGNVRVVFGTVYVAPITSKNAVPGRCYATATEARALAREELDYYRSIATDPRIQLVTKRSDLERVLGAPDPSVGIVMLMEGADPMLTPVDAADWFDAGVRIVGPAWHATRFCGGTGEPGPLTALGRELMPELNRTGAILDVSHMAEESFFQALELFSGHVIGSHSNVRARVPTDRQLSDEMIRALIARGAVIGTVLYNQFLVPGWREAGADKNAVSLKDVIANIRYVCDLAGDALHAGIGSDLDGGFGAEAAPREIDTVSDLRKIGDALSAAGFSDENVVNIMGGNWIRFLRSSLPD